MLERMEPDIENTLCALVDILDTAPTDLFAEIRGKLFRIEWGKDCGTIDRQCGVRAGPGQPGRAPSDCPVSGLCEQWLQFLSRLLQRPQSEPGPAVCKGTPVICKLHL